MFELRRELLLDREDLQIHADEVATSVKRLVCVNDRLLLSNLLSAKFLSISATIAWLSGFKSERNLYRGPGIKLPDRNNFVDVRTSSRFLYTVEISNHSRFKVPLKLVLVSI